ncbi:MAG: hypothetical protein WAM10_08960 [Methylocella sp.]
MGVIITHYTKKASGPGAEPKFWHCLLRAPIGRDAEKFMLAASSSHRDPNVWTGCISQLRTRGIAELADMYPAY